MQRRLYKAIPIALTVAAFLLALDSLYASDPSHWKALSRPWAYAACSVLLGGAAALFHALYLACRELEQAVKGRKQAQDERDAALSRPSLRLPHVLKALTRAGTDGQEEITLLLEPSLLFGTGSAASIYTMHLEFEVLLAEGRVTSIQQESRYIQLRITGVQQGWDTSWDALLRNDPTALTHTFVRPGNQAT